VGDGMTGEGGGGTNKNFKGIRFVEVGFDGVQIFGQLTLDDGFVLLFELIPRALKGLFRFGSFGEYHEAGGFSIETVNNPDPLFGAGMSLPDIFGKLEVCCFFRLSLTGDAEKIFGF